MKRMRSPLLACSRRRRGPGRRGLPPRRRLDPAARSCERTRGRRRHGGRPGPHDPAHEPRRPHRRHDQRPRPSIASVRRASRRATSRAGSACALGGGPRPAHPGPRSLRARRSPSTRERRRQRGLGHVAARRPVGDARGGVPRPRLVPFEGGWVTPAGAQRRARRARGRGTRSARAAAEADARAREAEARARTAEAEARRAEAAAQGGSGWSGSDWGYGGGYGPVYGGGYGGGYGNGVTSPWVRSIPMPGALRLRRPLRRRLRSLRPPSRRLSRRGLARPTRVTPHGSGTRPTRDSGGSRGSSAGRRH